MSIYDVEPEFPYCFQFEDMMYFAKESAKDELVALGIRIFVRKNWSDILEV